MFPCGDPPDSAPDPAASVGRRSTATGIPEVEVALDALLAEDGRGMLYLPFANYVAGNLDEARTMLLHPNAVPGLSDGGAHVGTICDGGFPTFLLSHWGVRRGEGRLPLGWLGGRPGPGPPPTRRVTRPGVLGPRPEGPPNGIRLGR